jgi:hypothetical protein
MAASGGAINPMTAGLILGGLQTARTGSLNKGLMAGLGAYGGAGLASGLVGAGAQQVAGEQIAKEAATNAAAEGISLPSNYAELAGRTATPAQLEAAKAGMSGFDAASKGFGAIQSGGLGAYQSGMQAMGGPSMMRAGLAAAAPVLMAAPQQPQMPVGDSTMPQRLKYEQGTATPFPQPDVPGYDDLGRDFGRQQRYFPNAGYVNITPEEAKSIRGYAAGGPIEAMSQANAVGENTGYPQADITGHAYATPWQTPVSQNVVAGTADTGVNRMTGQMLAEGGTATSTEVKPNENAAGVTGSGQLNLNVPLSIGGGSSGAGFGQQAPTGYSAAGSGVNEAPKNPFEGDETWKGYNDQFKELYGGLQSSDVYKNVDSLYRDMTNYYEGRKGDIANDANWTDYMNRMSEAQKALEGSDYFAKLKTLGQTAGNYYNQKMIDSGYNASSTKKYAQGGSTGGISDLGAYSDGGRLLRGPGDGVSDSIPAVIGKKRPARLADGEFVVPARIVSELGNGSTEAGARKLYAMLDRVQSARKKSIGKGKVANNSRADKYLPA